MSPGVLRAEKRTRVAVATTDHHMSCRGTCVDQTKYIHATTVVRASDPDLCHSALTGDAQYSRLAAAVIIA